MDIYPFDVMVSINQTDNQLGNSLDKNLPTEALSKEEIEGVRYTSDKCDGRAVMFSTNESLLRIRKLPETPAEYGVLAHEIFHISANILDRVGMKLVIEISDEAYSYLIGYLTKEIYTEINKYY